MRHSEFVPTDPGQQAVVSSFGEEHSSVEPPSVSRSLALLLATVLAPFAMAHFFSYVYRNVNALVYPDLARDLSLAADSIGLLTSAYLLTFAAAQLPIGIALDRFGPRKVQVVMLIVASLGAVLFARAHTVVELVVARGVIGLGVSGSLMSAIKASSLWLPPRMLPMSTSVLLAVGGLGAMASTTPMEWALGWTGWRGAFFALAAGTLAVSLLIFIVVPEHSGKKTEARLRDLAGAVGELYTSWSFWRLAVYTVMAHGTFMAVQGLWMGPWLRDVGHLGRMEVAQALLAGAAGMVLGALSFGWVTSAMQKRGFKPILVCGGGTLIFVLVQLGMVFWPSAWALPPMLAAAAFSFFGTATTMNYAIVAQSVPTHLTGRVSTAFNLVVFLVAFGIQWGLGALINLWAPVDGHYPREAYTVALGLNLLLQLPGLVLWLTFKPWQREPSEVKPSALR